MGKRSKRRTGGETLSMPMMGKGRIKRTKSK